MADIVDSATRSRMMRGIGSRDTKPEIRLRKALFAQGFRYRVNAKGLPGRPDILLPRYRAAIFVHGCFWHGHDCKRGARQPKTNAEYWRAKIARNVARDEAALGALTDKDWRVLTLWECELKHDDLDARLSAFLTDGACDKT